MAALKENKFRSELYKKYEECKKILIPKEQYFKMIEDIIETALTTSSKSRREYYLLSNYEILRCGDIEKLIKKGMTKKMIYCIMFLLKRLMM